MNLVDLIRCLAERHDEAVIVTSAPLETRDLTIIYANAAAARLTGYDVQELVGQSPRMLQGRRTNALVRREISRALHQRKPFSGVIENYRKSGEVYLCRLDIDAVLNVRGDVECYVAFEREVRRRRGRPSKAALSRFVTA